MQPETATSKSKVINIVSGGEFELLSNFGKTPTKLNPHSIFADPEGINAITFASTEAFLQRVKFPPLESGSVLIEADLKVFLEALNEDTDTYRKRLIEIRGLSGASAKKAGQRANHVYHTNPRHFSGERYLYWCNQRIPYESPARLQLIENVLREKFKQNRICRKLLIKTGSSELTHDTGVAENSNTILTQKEFIDILLRIRTELAKKTN